MNVDQVGASVGGAGRLRWGWAAVGAVLLGLSGPVGLVVMNVLQDRADAATQRACRDDRLNAHWSKGFDLALPVGLLVVLAVAVVLSIAVIAAGRRSPVWTKPVCALALFVSLLSALPIGLVATEYGDYPGGDISTNNSACGV